MSTVASYNTWKVLMMNRMCETNTEGKKNSMWWINKYSKAVSLFIGSAVSQERRITTYTGAAADESIPLEVSPYYEHALATGNAGQLRDTLDGVQAL